MVGEIIVSGTGAPYAAAVDSTNRLETRSVTRSSVVDGTIDGYGYTITSGTVTLTNAAASAILHYQNDMEEDLIITELALSTDDSANGTETFVVFDIYMGATGLGSGSGSPATIINMNAASSKTLTNTSEKGAQGATVTGGTALGPFYLPIKASTVLPLEAVLPQGSGIAFRVTPPASNTSLPCNINIKTHLLTAR